MRINILALSVASLLFVGCSQQVEQPVTPPQETKAQGGGETSNPSQDAVKTEEETKQEIREKLTRLTEPKAGYVLPTSDDGVVQDVSSLAEVTERLRKKGYSLPLAKALTAEFYKEQGASGAKKVMLIAKGGYKGQFAGTAEATFTKINRWAWQIVQKHPEDQLYGAHISTYEVEVLKDGTYRLNAWTNQDL